MKRCARIGHFSGARQMGAPSLAIPSETTNSEAQNLNASSGEEYEINLFVVDIKPEISTLHKIQKTRP